MSTLRIGEEPGPDAVSYELAGEPMCPVCGGELKSQGGECEVTWSVSTEKMGVTVACQNARDACPSFLDTLGFVEVHDG